MIKADLGLTIKLIQVKILPQLLDEWQERARLTKRDTVPGDPGHLVAGMGQGAAAAGRAHAWAGKDAPRGTESHLIRDGIKKEELRVKK